MAPKEGEIRLREWLKIWSQPWSTQDMEEGQKTHKPRSGSLLSQFESEIQKPQLKLQILPELQQEHVIKFCRKLVAEGIHHLPKKRREKKQKTFPNYMKTSAA